MRKLFGNRLMPALLLVLLLLGLPVAVWLDWRNATLENLQRQANDLNSIISSVRGYYADNVAWEVS